MNHAARKRGVISFVDRKPFYFQMQQKLKIRSYWVIYTMGFLAALCSFVMGYSHVFLSQMETIMQLKNNISLQQLALTLTLVISATNFGQIIGPFMYNSLANRYGEARAMIRCNVIIIVSICLQLIDLKFTYLLSGRLLLGFVIGIMSSILPLYLNSIAPLSISGKIGSMNQVLTCLGVITAYALGFIITEDRNDQIRWRILIGFPILPCLLSIVSLKWLFPYDRLERHIQNKEKDKLEAYVKSVYVNATVADIEREKIKVPNKESRGQYKKEIERYIIAMVVIASCQLSGINGIFYYAKQLFQDITGGDKLLSQKLMLGLSFCQVVSSVISGRFIDLFGRKYLLIRGQQTLIVILTLIFIVDNLDEYFSKNIIHYFIIFLLYLHVIAFNFSLGPVCIIYAAELVPNFSPIIITLRTFTFLVALSTNYLIHEFGIGQMFLMFGVLSSVAYYYLKDKLRQTKGKSKPQIYDMFESQFPQTAYEEERITLV